MRPLGHWVLQLQHAQLAECAEACALLIACFADRTMTAGCKAINLHALPHLARGLSALLCWLSQLSAMGHALVLGVTCSTYPSACGAHTLLLVLSSLPSQKLNEQRMCQTGASYQGSHTQPLSSHD